MSVPLPSQVKFAPRPNVEPPTQRSTKPPVPQHEISVEEFVWGSVGVCSCGEFRSSIETDVKRHLELNRRKPIYGKRPDHLNRPLKDNEALKALRDSLAEGAKAGRPHQDKRQNRRAQRP